jgi:hypothetical protein
MMPRPVVLGHSTMWSRHAELPPLWSAGGRFPPACSCQALGVAAHVRVVTSGLDADGRQSHGVPYRLPEPRALGLSQSCRFARTRTWPIGRAAKAELAPVVTNLEPRGPVLNTGMRIAIGNEKDKARRYCPILRRCLDSPAIHWVFASKALQSETAAEPIVLALR